MNVDLDDHWHKVCRLKDIEVDRLKKFEFKNVEFLLIRMGEECRAIPPFCPHMAEPLEESGLCNQGVLTCSKHLWQWDLATGSKRGPSEKPLQMYETSIVDEEIWVRIEKELGYDYNEEDEDDFEW